MILTQNLFKQNSTYKLEQKVYYIDNVITLPVNCTLMSDLNPIGIQHPPRIENELLPKVVFRGNGKLLLEDSVKIKGIYFQRDEAKFCENPIFKGTCIEFKNYTGDQVIEDCLILGFEYGIRSVENADNCSRMRINRVNMDCLYPIYLENSWDITYIREVHAWPFLTTAFSGNGNSKINFRNSTAFYLGKVNDWTKLTDCFSYGYNIGYHIKDARSVVLSGCGADHIPGKDNSIGFLIDGDEALLTNCQTAQKGTGYVINGKDCRLTNCATWQHVNKGITANSSTGIVNAMVKSTHTGEVASTSDQPKLSFWEKLKDLF